MSGVAPLRKVVLVVGTRPEAIKVAPLARALADAPGWEPVVISTGQHGEVVDDVLSLFGVEVAVRHVAWERGGALAELHTALVGQLTGDLERLRPDAVLVQGDTATVLAGAMAAFWLQIPVVHLEAGLRSGDLAAPFPEEANRRLVTQLAALHLAPTAGAAAALAREGTEADRVVVTGNTVIDALRWLQGSGRIDLARSVRPEDRRLALVTCHRRENWGGPMSEVAEAVRRLAVGHDDVDFVVATHPNPVVRDLFVDALRGQPNVEISEPIDYLTFLGRLSQATLVLTDSGGVQEEAPAFGVPVLVLREVTERPEGMTAGVARLVGTDTATIVSAADQLLSNPIAHRAMANAVNPYGDGEAARRCFGALGWLLNDSARPDEFGDPVPQSALRLATIGT